MDPYRDHSGDCDGPPGVDIDHCCEENGYGDSGAGRSNRLIVDGTGNHGRFRTIGEALGSASAGDTVEVWTGTYRETIDVDEGMSIVGNGSSRSVILGDADHGAVVTVHGGVRLDGLGIAGVGGASTGLLVLDDGNQIRNCTFRNHSTGIRMEGSDGNLLENCTVEGSAAPIVPYHVVLYDSVLKDMPNDQEMSYLAYPPFTAEAEQRYEQNMTVLDTTGQKGDYAGYFNYPERMPELDRNEGFALGLRVRLFEEEHAGSDRDGDGKDDRAGFSVIILAADLMGIELGFWEDEIWAQEGGQDVPPNGDMFTHAEGADFNTTAWITDYSLELFQDNYFLMADGDEILTGPLRDYTEFTGTMDPYETANLVFLGDDTSSAKARVGFEYAALRIGRERSGAGRSLPALPDSGTGMKLYNSDDNHIRYCDLLGNQGDGVVLVRSSDNVFTGCSYGDNLGRGMNITDGGSASNSIHRNAFTGNNQNGVQAVDNGLGNLWDRGGSGNYWDDYAARYPNAGNDRVMWDVPYGMDGGADAEDEHPLVSPGVFEDIYPPELLGDRTAATGTTGDEFTFNLSAADNVGVTEVSVNWSQGARSENLHLELTEGFWTGDIVLSETVLELHYRVRISDMAGNVNVSDERIVTVQDDDPPVIFDRTDGVGTTGDVFVFTVEAGDNSAVAQVSVNWSHGNLGGNASLSMNGGNWTGIIRLDHSIHNITYDIFALDSYGNMAKAQRAAAAVSDNDPPTAHISVNGTVYAGESTPLGASGSMDNIGITNYTWWVNAANGSMPIYGETADMVFTEPGIYAVTLRISDAAGNADSDLSELTVVKRHEPGNGTGGQNGTDVNGSDGSGQGNGTDVRTNGTEDDDNTKDNDDGGGEGDSVGKERSNVIVLGLVLGAVLLLVVSAVVIIIIRTRRERTEGAEGNGGGIKNDRGGTEAAGDD